MYFLTYISSATQIFSQEELLELLKVCRRNNETLQITGMLLYHEGTFIQAIEGEKENVVTLHEKISRDRRHRGMITLLKGETDRRQFSDWSMGFKLLADLSPDEWIGLNQKLRLPEYKEQLPHPIVRLMEDFKSRIV